MKAVSYIKFFFKEEKKIHIEHVFTNIFRTVFGEGVVCLILGTSDFLLLCFPFYFCS